MNTASSGSSWTSRLCYGKVCLCLTNALGRPLVSVSDFGTLGRISNLNAPATFLEGRKIRVIKYLMNIPQIFSKINPIVRDFRGLVSGKNQAAADRYYHQLHLKPWAKSPEEAAWALMQRIMGLVGEHKVPPLRGNLSGIWGSLGRKALNRAKTYYCPALGIDLRGSIVLDQGG